MGLSINIATDEKYAGPVPYAAAKEICNMNLYKMGNEYIGIVNAPSLDFDKVVVAAGKRSESFIFDMVSTIRMQSNNREKTKTIKVKKLNDIDARGKEYTIYKVV